MSLGYTLEHVINECLREKANVLNTARGKTTEAKVDIYASSWGSLNAWIEARLAQHKGASIAGFGSFCWEMVEKNGETHCRPLFIISDSFVKTFHVRRARIHRIPQLTPVEEANFSMLAIKYSKHLTKDMVFSGVRDIIRKIGEYVSRGYEMSIEFPFGTLTSKENRVKFHFNQSRLIEILPENLQPGVYATNDKPMKYIMDNTSSNHELAGDEEGNDDFNSSLNSARNIATPDLLKRPSTSMPATGRGQSSSFKAPTVPSLDFSKKNTAVPTANKPASNAQAKLPAMTGTFSSLTSGTSNGIAMEAINKAAADTYSFENTNNDFSFTQLPRTADPATNEDRSPTPPDLRAVLDAIGNRNLKVSKDEWRNQAKERVIAQAFNRCLSEVEEAAKKEEHQRFESKRQFDTWKDTMTTKKVQGKEQMVELKKALDEQLQEHNERMAKEKYDLKHSKVASILPDDAGTVRTAFSSIVTADGKVINGRQRIAKDLEKQIHANEERKVKERMESLAKESDYLNRLALENEYDKVMSRTQQLEKQKAMLEAWERDCHVKNVKKLQTHGSGLVKDYIDRNLVEHTSKTFDTTLSQSLNMSIGYDPRRGKV